MLLRCTHKPIVYKNTNLIYKKENKQEPKTLLGRKFYRCTPPTTNTQFREFVEGDSGFTSYEFNETGCKMVVYGMFGTILYYGNVYSDIGYNEDYTKWDNCGMTDDGEYLIYGEQYYKKFNDIDEIKIIPNIDKTNVQIYDDLNYIYVSYDKNIANFNWYQGKDVKFYKNGILQNKCLLSYSYYFAPHLDAGHWKVVLGVQNIFIPSDKIDDAYEIEFDISNDSVYKDGVHKDATLTVEGNNFKFDKVGNDLIAFRDTNGNFHALSDCTSTFSIEGLEPTIDESEQNNNRRYIYNIPNVVISGYDLPNQSNVTVTIGNPIKMYVESWCSIILDIGINYMFKRTTHMN